MTETTIPTAVPGNEEPSAGTPGVMLRDARESAGLSLAAVGEALHLTVHYIKALENDDYSKLPGLIFVKGYIRAYGQYLKMDVDALLQSYDAQVGSIRETVSPSINTYDRRLNHRRRSDQSLGWALVAGFIVLVALGAGWWFVGRDQNGGEQAAANTPAPLPVATAVARTGAVATSPASTGINSPATAPFSAAATTISNTDSSNAAMMTMAAPAPDAHSTAAVAGVSAPTADVTSAATTITPSGEVLQTTVSDDGLTIIPAADGSRQINMFRAGNDELLLRFAGDSWVEIDDGANARLYSDMLNAGDTLTVQGTAPFQMLLGNARNVQVNFNDSNVDIAMSIREDDSARVLLANPSTAVPVAGAGVAQ